MPNFQPRPYKTIKQSMLETIADEWKMQGSIDSLDPFVQMLLSACADELARIEDKFHTSQSNILNRLAELLMPDEWDIPKPAFGVLKASIAPYEENAVATIKPNNHFLTSLKVNDAGEDYYLSATGDFQILGAEIVFLANKDNFNKVENVHKKTFLKGNTHLHSHTIWLGIEYNPNLKNLQGLRFFFDWPVDQEKTMYYSYIKNSKWFLNGIEITPNKNESIFSASKSSNIVLSHYEDSAQKFYQNAFVNFTQSIPIENEKFTTPFELDSFQNEIINQRVDNLLWLKVEFPQDMPYEAIKRFYCTTNAFPVINRKINEPITYKIQGETNLIPIITRSSEEFFAIEEVVGKNGQALVHSLRRKGVERFDNRDAKELLRYVTNVLQDEIHAFRELNTGNFISENIDEAKKNFERILQKLNENLDNWQNKIYVYVESSQSKNEEIVDVKFWTTTSFIQTPSSLTDFRADNTEGINSDCLLLTIQTGKQRPSENEKIVRFRNKLMARGRVVTHQDLKLFCFEFIGDKLDDVEIKKDVIIGNDYETGFLRCISVRLIPRDTTPNKSEWSGLCYEISNLLNEQMQVMPIKVDYQR